MSGIEKRVSGLYFLNHMKFFSLLLYSLFGLWEYGGNEKEVKISFFFFFWCISGNEKSAQRSQYLYFSQHQKGKVALGLPL